MAEPTTKREGKAYEYGALREDGRFIEGAVHTKYGMVDAFAQHGFDQFTSLYFIYDGKEHHWSWSKGYRRNYIVTLAKRMAREIVDG